VLAEERRPGEELAAVLAAGPRRHDAPLALRRNPKDPCRHPAEHDLSTAGCPHCVGARAVDRGPDDLERRIVCCPRRCEHRLAPLDGAHVDAESVPLVPDAAHEALAKHRAPDPDVPRRRLLGVHGRHGQRRLDVDRPGMRLRDQPIPVEEQHRATLAVDVESALERRRKPERHLHRVGVDEGRQTAARVAAVRRRERASEAPFEHDGHGRHFYLHPTRREPCPDVDSVCA
jgi:hypothetical protein